MGFLQTFRNLAVLCTFIKATLALPHTYGIVLYRNFDPLDVVGPMEVLMHIGKMHRTDIALISSTMDPVSARPAMPAMNPLNSSVYLTIPPTHTFSTAPALDDLIIAGGPGWRNPAHDSTVEYVRETVTNKKVQHVLTICTGSALAARAGILDGRRATTNKYTWDTNVAAGPNVTWVPSARWVEDDGDAEKGEVPVWSSSGVASGIDLMLRWVQHMYGERNASFVERIMEVQRIQDPSFDPFARNGTGVV